MSIIFVGGLGGRSLGSIISGGTNIGDLTANGGLAASFDGTTNQSGAASSSKSSATAAFIGKTVTKRVFKLISYGTNNNGYVAGINPTVTLDLRAQVGGSAPANVAAALTAGVSLGTLASTDTANESGNPREIISSDNETIFDHVWTVITHNGATNQIQSAEQQYYEAV